MRDTIHFSSLFTLDSLASTLPPGLIVAPSDSALAFLEQIHRRNSEALKFIVEDAGWPSAETVGEEAEAAAFMIVQHADYDPEFQRACHRMMLESARRGDMMQIGFLACLTDRILCNDGKPQRFGTQIREVPNGCFVPKPIEDPDHIDEMRRQAGLDETLADYLQRVNDGDLMLYRPLMGNYAEQLEHARPTNVIPFPKNPH